VVALVVDVNVAGSEGAIVVVNDVVGDIVAVEEVEEVDVVVVDVVVDPEKFAVVFAIVVVVGRRSWSQSS
jgi:hypothetical protein